MNCGRLESSDLGGSSRSTLSEVTLTPTPAGHASKNKKKFIFLSLLAIALVIASAVSAAILVGHHTRAHNGSGIRQPTQAISRTCSKTRYPSLCVSSLLDVPGSTQASEHDLVHISFNMTLQHLNKALYYYSGISNLQMDTRVRSAYEDCFELLDSSVDAIARSLTSVESQSEATAQDVLTWVSAALTNQDTCEEGFSDLSGTLKEQMAAQLKDLSKLVSNCLAIYAANMPDDFSGVPIQNRRRLLEESVTADFWADQKRKFPKWLSLRDRRLLNLPVSKIQADMVVSASGNGTYKTIGEAIKKAPQLSSRRTIIYVRAGRYEEKNLKVGRKQWNLMFIGDGKGSTVITGGSSVAGGSTTFHSASFAASGTGFIARDITFENYAGPGKHQAVALRVGADHAVVYRCSIIGYQDTCYVHSNRQFFRECDIYGTVDFIFGNAAVVFQNCNLNARKPMANQKNTITAQNRKDPNQNTGISIHNCRILPTPDLEAVKGSVPTYLGRPWKLYSRTVYMLSYMADHINPRGWLEWNGNFALNTLYYGEYMNSGPGAALGQRVNWPGHRVITSTAEANRFTVAQFISGTSWLPSTQVAFIAGLTR